MCLLLFSFSTTPGFRLILAANRDEFLHRPTTGLNYIDVNKPILAGRDLKEGGTWFGINTNGRIAAVTNYRDPSLNREGCRSRGEIPTQYLNTDISTKLFLERLNRKAGEYNGFNVVAGNSGHLYHYSNITGTITSLKAGIYGLSNHLLDTPWPKVTRGKNSLRNLLGQGPVIDNNQLFAMLADTVQPPVHTLPQTGVGPEWEQLLSSMFITSPSYGTRSSAAIIIDNDGCVSFSEKTYSHHENGYTAERILKFTIQLQSGRNS